MTNVARLAFSHLLQVKQLVPFLSCPGLVTVIHETDTSRLDYCNMLYAGLPLRLTQNLQLVQNVAMHVLKGTPFKFHTYMVLHQLH